MERSNKVFKGCSIDGYIADKNGGLDHLDIIPNPLNIDMGCEAFISEKDAIVMGRITFETVLAFDIEWPFTKPVFVLSNSLTTVPDLLKGKVELIKGSLTEMLNQIHLKGHGRLYLDGGTIIQNFLKEDLIDEMIITTIPILLGGGFPLFADLIEPLRFKYLGNKVYLDEIVQNRYGRIGFVGVSSTGDSSLNVHMLPLDLEPLTDKKI